MRKRSNSTMTQVFSELSLGIRGKKLNDTKSTQVTCGDCGTAERTQVAKMTNYKRIEEKAKDDRMSNHATFIAAKRQEIASLTAQIETKLTRQGDPLLPLLRRRARRTSSRLQNCRVQKRRRPWPARKIWKPKNSQPFTNQRSSLASQSASTVDVELQTMF